MTKRIANGTRVTIKARPWDWGKVIDFDGEYYHVAIFDDMDSVLIFERSEISVPRRARA